MLAFHLNRNAATATVLVAALAVAVLAGGEARAQSAPATARFFTINEILAKQETARPNARGRVAAVVPGATANDVVSPRGVPGPEPFGMFAFKAPDGELWTKWRALEAELAREMKSVDACRSDAKQCSAAAKRFLAIVGEIRARTGRPQLETANRLMNGAIRYTSDLQQHGVPDRWTAPLATLKAEAGDCEDYAIAKFAVLRDAGVPEKDMRLVLVRDTAIKIDHAVLAVRSEGGWLLLDNRKTFVAEPQELKHYMPLFALDRDGVKLFAAPLASWGEGGGEFADWNLRGSDGAETAALGDDTLDLSGWRLRGTNAEPAARN